MGEVDHFAYGIITPILAYAMSVLGSLLGLTCTALARTARTTARRAWFLLLAAWAIGGTGIWVMHFIAMIGFGVEGSDIRYDVPITTASAVIAIAVVVAGLAVVGFGRPGPVKIVLGGVFTGVGVASMHYTGMAAMRIHGTVVYDDVLVGASVAIAVVAATVALWFTVTVRKPAAVIASALVMGVAVSGMHYTGMFAMTVHPRETGPGLTGSTPFGLLLPIVLLVALVIMGLVYAVVSAPTDEDRAGAAYLDARLNRLAHGPAAGGSAVSRPAASGPAAGGSAAGGPAVSKPAAPREAGPATAGRSPAAPPGSAPAVGTVPASAVRRANGHPAPLRRTPTVGSALRRRGNDGGTPPPPG